MSRIVTVNFGSRYTGLASNIFYSVVGSADAILLASSNTGVEEVVDGSGLYRVEITAAEASWKTAEVRFDVQGVSPPIAASLVIDFSSPVIFQFPGGGGPDGGFSFDPTKVGTDVLHYVRLQLGDTVETTAILGDDTINSMTEALGLRQGLVQLCKAIASEYARRATQSENEQTRTTYIDRSNYFLELSKGLAVAVLPANMIPEEQNDTTPSVLVVAVGGILNSVGEDGLF